MDRLRWNRDFALEQAADDMELLNELMEIFKESCLSDYRILEEGVNTSNAEMICSAAHSIKGASASLGIEAIKDIARDIESDSRSGSLRVAREKFADLGSLLQILQKIKKP